MLSHHPDHFRRLSCYCAARAFSFTSFASATSKSFTIRTSKTPLPQPLYNPHLQAPLGSAGNKGLITPLESALTSTARNKGLITPLESTLTKNPPVSLLESALAKRWGVGGTPIHSHRAGPQSHPEALSALLTIQLLTFNYQPPRPSECQGCGGNNNAISEEKL